MKTWLSLGVGILVSLPLFGAEMRTFTSSDGQEIRARLLRVENDIALIEREDRQQFRLAIDRLSEEDQHFVRRWTTLSALANERTVGITTRRLRLHRKEFRNAPDVDPAHAYRRTEEELAMQIVLHNRGVQDLENIHIEYRIFKDKTDFNVRSNIQVPVGAPLPGVRPIPVVKSGKLHLETLPALSQTVLQTDPFVLISLDREDWGPYNPNTGLNPVVRFQRSDTFTGIWLRVMEGDEVIREVTSPESLSLRVKWR